MDIFAVNIASVFLLLMMMTSMKLILSANP